MARKTNPWEDTPWNDLVNPDHASLYGAGQTYDVGGGNVGVSKSTGRMWVRPTSTSMLPSYAPRKTVTNPRTGAVVVPTQEARRAHAERKAKRAQSVIDKEYAEDVRYKTGLSGAVKASVDTSVDLARTAGSIGKYVWTGDYDPPPEAKSPFKPDAKSEAASAQTKTAVPDLVQRYKDHLSGRGVFVGGKKIDPATYRNPNGPMTIEQARGAGKKSRPRGTELVPNPARAGDAAEIERLRSAESAMATQEAISSQGAMDSTGPMSIPGYAGAPRATSAAQSAQGFWQTLSEPEREQAKAQFGLSDMQVQALNAGAYEQFVNQSRARSAAAPNIASPAEQAASGSVVRQNLQELNPLGQAMQEMGLGTDKAAYLRLRRMQTSRNTADRKMLEAIADRAEKIANLESSTADRNARVQGRQQHEIRLKQMEVDAVSGAAQAKAAADFYNKRTQEGREQLRRDAEITAAEFAGYLGRMTGKTSEDVIGEQKTFQKLYERSPSVGVALASAPDKEVVAFSMKHIQDALNKGDEETALNIAYAIQNSGPDALVAFQQAMVGSGLTYSKEEFDKLAQKRGLKLTW